MSLGFVWSTLRSRATPPARGRGGDADGDAAREGSETLPVNVIDRRECVNARADRLRGRADVTTRSEGRSLVLLRAAPAALSARPFVSSSLRKVRFILDWLDGGALVRGGGAHGCRRRCACSGRQHRAIAPDRADARLQVLAGRLRRSRPRPNHQAHARRRRARRSRGRRRHVDRGTRSGVSRAVPRHRQLQAQRRRPADRTLQQPPERSATWPG